MHGEGFRRLHAASAVDLHHAVELRQRLVAKTYAGTLEHIECLRETLRNSLVKLLKGEPLHHAHANTCKRRGISRLKPVARHHRISLGTRFHRSSDRPN